MKMKTFLTLLAVFFVQTASAGLLFNYTQLMIKDLDQMNQIVLDKIAESRASDGEKTVPLREALQAVYSRPDSDGMIEKLVGNLRTELDEHNAWEETLNKLTVEALNALRNPRAFNSKVQVTYQIFLENLMSELNPLIVPGSFERGLVEKIRDAQVKLSKEASAERQLRMLKAIQSPSDLAAALLKRATPSGQAEQKDEINSEKKQSKSSKSSEKKKSDKKTEEKPKKPVIETAEDSEIVIEGE